MQVRNFPNQSTKIPVIRNNNLVFDVSDTSLEDYNFKIFYDNQFKNELVSVGGTVTDISVTGVGTVGLGQTATVTLNFSSELPSKLYYALEKAGYISSADTFVQELFRNLVC